MENKKNRKGFTLAELLIVVAIIAVLVAIAIPIFTKQLERSREATDLSNIRSAYAEANATYLAKGAKSSVTASVTTVAQKESKWQMGSSNAKLNTRIDGKETSVSIPASTLGGWQVKVAKNGKVTVTEK